MEIGSEEWREFDRLNRAWLGGEKIPQLKFLFNSKVRAVNLDENVPETGWIVGVDTEGAELIYQIEAEDGSGDFQALESTIEVLDLP